VSIWTRQHQSLAHRADANARASGLGAEAEKSRISLEEQVLLAGLEQPHIKTATESVPLNGIPTPTREVLLQAVLENVEKRRAYIYDNQQGIIIAGGERLAELYGYSHDEIMDMQGGWLSLIHPADMPHVQESTGRLVAAKCEVASVQMRVACKDGHWEWIQHDWRALTRDETGRMQRGIGIVQIITPMAMANQALSNEAALNALCRMLVEEWVEGIFLLDSAWEIVYANQGALEKLGYTQEELFGRPLQKVIHIEVARRHPPYMPRSEQKLVQRATQTRKDGVCLPVEINLRRLTGERLLVTTRDITDQLAFEDAARRQTAYYRGLFENNPSGVAVFDSDFQITEVNPALRNMLAYTDRQLIQKNLAYILDADSQLDLDTWRSLSAQEEKISTDAEVTLRRRDGRLLNAHAALTLMSDARVSGCRGILILTDISARRMAEEELARQFQLNNTLLRESAAMIGMVDREGRIVKVNPAVEMTSGYSAGELVGKLIWESGLVDEEEVPKVRARLQRLLDGEPRVTAMSRGRTKSGELRVLHVHNTAMRDACGEVEHFIITAIDMTEQQRLQHHLMEAVEQEQARIGHDLHDSVGQILTGIGVMTEMLQARLSGAEREEAGRIHELAREAIHQVRQLSRSMSPAAVQHRDLTASLLLLADTVRTSLRRNCECHLDPQVQVTDPACSGHLFRIAQEAVNNAIRHGNPSLVTLSLWRDDAGNGFLEVFNDGTPFDCKSGSEGIGMSVMNYRASLIHADVSLSCPVGGGVKVTCKFPLPPVGKKSPQTKTKRQKP